VQFFVYHVETGTFVQKTVISEYADLGRKNYSSVMVNISISPGVYHIGSMWNIQQTHYFNSINQPTGPEGIQSLTQNGNFIGSAFDNYLFKGEGEANCLMRIQGIYDGCHVIQTGFSGMTSGGLGSSTGASQSSTTSAFSEGPTGSTTGQTNSQTSGATFGTQVTGHTQTGATASQTTQTVATATQTTQTSQTVATATQTTQTVATQTEETQTSETQTGSVITTGAAGKQSTSGISNGNSGSTTGIGSTTGEEAHFSNGWVLNVSAFSIFAGLFVVFF